MSSTANLGVATLPCPPHPQSQFSTADSATHFATTPTGAPPDSYSHWSASAPLESSRLPTAPVSCPREENGSPNPLPWPDVNRYEYPKPRGSFPSPARRPAPEYFAIRGHFLASDSSRGSASP